MNVSSILTTIYENKHNWTLGQNKPNSNPIKPNFQKAQMNVNSLITKDYRKKDDFVVRKNKPNSNPISEKPKMNVNVFIKKDYENETALRPKKTNPNKANFKRHISLFCSLESIVCCLQSVFCSRMKRKMERFSQFVRPLLQNYAKES